MEIVVLFLMLGVVAALLYTLLRLRKSDFTFLAHRMARKSRENLEVLKPCPICGTMLRRGETVHSVVYSGGGKKPEPGRPVEYITHIFGCPYCYPVNEKVERTCPVCRRPVPEDGYVVARMFEKPGRNHVHVIGCTRCRRVDR
jgi:hypothetical protein